MLSWLLDSAQGEDRSALALTQRVLILNFVAVRTSSVSFTHALLHLAARLEYISPLREEVEQIIREEGSTIAAVKKMREVDSFLREAQRYRGIGTTSMARKVLVNYTLSDGTFLPAGTFIDCNAYAEHMDGANYEKAMEFQPFRFADTRKEDTEDKTGALYVSTSVKYLRLVMDDTLALDAFSRQSN